MKKTLFTLISMFVAISMCATVWTVSNDPNRPAQFTTLQAAIDVASPGDTLRIAGSNTQYSGVDLYFPMVFIGEGANNPDGYSTVIDRKNNSYYYSLALRNLNSSLGASGSKFYGIYFTSYTNFHGNFTGQSTGVNNKIENVVFERCRWTSYPDFQNGFFNNILFRNCVFPGNSYKIYFSSAGPYSGIVFTNCVNPNISGPGSNYPFNGGVIVRNSIYLNTTYDAFSYAYELIVENCIFYKAEPTGAENSVFNNNLTYLCDDNALPYGTNAGSGNIINADPLFIDYPNMPTSFSWSHDYGLQAGSPASGTGTNGTDMGLTGGNSPVNNIPGHSRIPVVTEITLPNSSVPVGGNLEINVKAKTRN